MVGLTALIAGIVLITWGSFFAVKPNHAMYGLGMGVALLLLAALRAHRHLMRELSRDRIEN